MRTDGIGSSQRTPHARLCNWALFMAGFIRLLIMVALVAFLPNLAASDLIVLKDGSQVKAQNVWEENDLVRFTLPGYDGIVVTYAKEIVLRIEKEKAVSGAVASPPDSRPQKTAAESAAAEKALPVDKPDKKSITSGLPGIAVEPSRPLEVVDTRPVESSRAGRGVPSTPVVTSSSVEAGQIPVTNDEDAENRMAKGVTVSQDTVDEELVQQVTGIHFYEPRRHYKYQTDTTTSYHTLKEAVDDLAAKFDKTPRWVELNLGDTNDLGQIYRNLSRPLDNTQPETEGGRTTSGLLFYDPRRAEKYWVSSDSRHWTMEEAIDTLAQQYKQTPDWIIAHLGGSNDLVEIHRNLARSAASETGQKYSGNLQNN